MSNVIPLNAKKGGLKQVEIHLQRTGKAWSFRVRNPNLTDKSFSLDNDQLVNAIGSIERVLLENKIADLVYSFSLKSASENEIVYICRYMPNQTTN